MRLTKEEKNALMREILDDLPEGFSLFPPWMWLALAEIILLILGGGWLAIALSEIFQLEPGVAFGIAIFIAIFGVCVPNFFIIQAGKNIFGVRYLRIVAIAYIVLSMPCLFLDWPKPTLGATIIIISALVLWVTYTIRFQALALHLKRMADWRREREKKNRSFREDVKRKRQAAGKKW